MAENKVTEKTDDHDFYNRKRILAEKRRQAGHRAIDERARRGGKMRYKEFYRSSIR